MRDTNKCYNFKRIITKVVLKKTRTQCSWVNV